VNREQLLLEIRKELGVNERLANLLRDYAKMYADAALRLSYTTNDGAMLIRQAGMSEGVEKFIDDVTAAPKALSEKGPSQGLR
jgi:hypothetical protein